MLLGIKNVSSYFDTFWRRIKALASAVAHLPSEEWSRREEGILPAEPYLGEGIVGIVDVFPVYIRRPKARCKRELGACS